MSPLFLPLISSHYFMRKSCFLSIYNKCIFFHFFQLNGHFSSVTSSSAGLPPTYTNSFNYCSRLNHLPPLPVSLRSIQVPFACSVTWWWRGSALCVYVCKWCIACLCECAQWCVFLFVWAETTSLSSLIHLQTFGCKWHVRTRWKTCFCFFTHSCTYKNTIWEWNGIELGQEF